MKNLQGVINLTKSKCSINLASVFTRGPQWWKFVTSAPGSPESHYTLPLATPDKLQTVHEFENTVNVCTGRNFRISAGPARGTFGQTQNLPSNVFTPKHQKPDLLFLF
jgi:hypothetical protein